MKVPRAAADSDVLSGCVFMTIGTAAIVAGRNYELGSLSRMGPGFFPSCWADFCSSSVR